MKSVNDQFMPTEKQVFTGLHMEYCSI
jgi:hypothetical protein